MNSNPIAANNTMTFEDVKRYIATHDIDDPNIGNASLSSIRDQIHENESEHERLKKHLLHKRAMQKAEQVKQLTLQQKQAREEKTRSTAALEELRRSQEVAKQKEMRAGLERERVLRQLQGVNEERLEELSKERTKELQVIELERKALLQREKEMDDMVKNLESNLNAQTDRMTNRMESLQDEIEKSKSKDREGAVKEEKGKREKIERNYGTVMARIEKERELIVEEKQALKAKETRVLKGGSTEGLDDALEKYLKEISTNKGQRSQQERIKKLRMQEEEDALENEDLVKEANSTSTSMKSRLPLPKDAMESLESWLKGETETLDYKDVAISPTRTREKIVFKEVYVEKKPEPEPGPEGSVGGVDASVASNSDDGDKDSDNDSDDDDKENGSEDAESESDLEDFYAQADSIDVAMKKSESKTKVGSKKEKKKASKKDKKKKGSADSILAEIEALKAAAANNPNINRAQVLGAIAQLEEEARNQGVFRQQPQQNPLQPNSQQQQHHQQDPYSNNSFAPRMGSYGAQSMAPPPPYAYSNGADTSSQVMQMQMQMQMMQQQNEQRQQQALQQAQQQMQTQMQQQLQQYMQMFQQQTQQMESENQRLQEEVANLADLATGSQPMGYGGGYNQPAMAPQQQQQQQQQLQQQQQHPQQPDDAIIRHSSVDGEVDMMSFMNSLPESKRLDKLKVDHLEYMAKLRFEKERLEQEASINQIKEKLDAEREALHAKQQHEKWLAEQKRQIQALRVQQALAREMPVVDPNSSAVASKSAAKNIVYDPQTGFKIFWDYALNLPRKAKGSNLARTRVVYCLYSGMTPYSKLRATKWLETEKAGQAACQTIYAQARVFNKVSPLLELQLVLQIQFTHVADPTLTSHLNEKPFGWCAFPLFQDSTKREDPVLRYGNYKMPLHPGVFVPSFLSTANKEKAEGEKDATDTEPMKPALYFRVRHGAQKPEAFSVEPDMTQHLYKNLHDKDESEDEDEKENGKQKKKKKKKKVEETSSEEEEEEEEEGEGGGDNEDEEDDDAHKEAHKDHGVDHDHSKHSQGEAASPSPANVPLENEHDGVEKWNHRLSVTVKRLELLPHAHLEDQKTTLSVSLEADEKSLYTTKATKPKPTDGGGVFYAYKKQVYALETSDSLRSVNVSISSGGKVLFSGGLLKLLDDHGKPMLHDQQVQLFKEGETGEGEPSGHLMVGIAYDGADEGSVKSHSSKRSKRSDRKKKKQQEALASNLLQEEIQEEVPEMEMEEIDIESEPQGEEPFVKYEDTTTQPVPFEAADGVDVYIDGARSLPNNVSVTKVILQCKNKSGKVFNDDANDKMEQTCDLSGTVFSPKFQLYKEYRSDQFDPTLTLLIRVDTKNLKIKKNECVGYGVLNMFTEVSDRKAQPGNANTQEFALNTGCFQVQLYKKGPDTKSNNFSGQSLEGQKRVSCATVLVRIVAAPKDSSGMLCLSRSDSQQEEWERLGLAVPAPEYSSGVYDSTRCLPTGLETDLYQFRRGNNGTPLDEYVLQQLAKEQPDKDISSFEKEARETWITKTLEGKTAGFLDYTFMKEYSTESGFKVCIDGLHKMKGGGVFSSAPFYKALYLLNPPALFYQDGSMTEDVQFTREYDIDSDQTAPIFKDNFFKWNAEDSASMSLIVEVRAITKKKKEFVVSDQPESYWGALPIFRKEEPWTRYVASGCYNIPLFEGKVPQAALDAEDIYDWICSDLKKPKKEKTVVLSSLNSSAVIRIVDSCVEEFTERQKTVNMVNQDYIKKVVAAAGKNLDAYDYNPSMEPGKPVSKLLASKKDEERL
eukprot:CAMPEP_0182506334 /NCGR_PEP_ID=MMETSP1321-20130603/20971_1 /TAXON_ID=91990 /ORGANISM="Bolidomonas sp., Strain RCC1657" /LENGTH=1787 /DNA_ID=CAMNT_0024712049 /DNA_START=223 /DNA_END=5583 /DNA_ORIENTATION=-